MMLFLPSLCLGHLAYVAWINLLACSWGHFFEPLAWSSLSSGRKYIYSLQNFRTSSEIPHTPIWCSPRHTLSLDQIDLPPCSSGHFLSSNVSHGHKTPCYYIHIVAISDNSDYLFQKYVIFIVQSKIQTKSDAAGSYWWKSKTPHLVAKISLSPMGDSKAVCWKVAIDGG